MIGVVCGLVFAAHGALAQPSAPPMPAPNNRLVTAGEDVHGIRMLRANAEPDVAAEYRQLTALDLDLQAQAKVWISALQAKTVKGLQLDAAGELYVAAGQNEMAQRQFAERLATPGLSMFDRAYALNLAVEVFAAQPNDTARMRIAAAYAKQLDLLPDVAARYQFNTHQALGNAYFLAGDGRASLDHLLRAFARFPSIPFLQRKSPTYPFYWLSNILSGQPDGRRRIDSVGALVLSLLQASPEQLAISSLYRQHSEMETADFKKALQFTSYLGRPAPPIVAQYWWNASVPTAVSPLAAGAKTLSLDDGNVRLIELGSVTCMWCLFALKDMEAIHKSLPPNAEAWYVTRGYGMWGAEACGPDVEADRLKFKYLTQKRLTLPIALWIGPRKNDEDGGSLAPNNPMWSLFGIDGGPIFFITDGRGIVRNVSTYSAGLVPQQRTIRFLVAEAAQQSPSASMAR